mgnify:CR=1 FL=1
MKNDISKSICKALIFTVLPFAIPLIFEIIPNTFINNAGKIIIVLLLFAIDTYFVFKITVRDCKELNDAKNIIDTNKRFYGFQETECRGKLTSLFLLFRCAWITDFGRPCTYVVF